MKHLILAICLCGTIGCEIDEERVSRIVKNELVYICVDRTNNFLSMSKSYISSFEYITTPEEEQKAQAVLDSEYHKAFTACGGIEQTESLAKLTWSWKYAVSNELHTVRQLHVSFSFSAKELIQKEVEIDLEKQRLCDGATPWQMAGACSPFLNGAEEEE
jgi:hypothetical protein